MSGIVKLLGLVLLGVAAIWIIPMITGLFFKVGIAVLVIVVIAALFWGNKLKKSLFG